MVGGGNKPGMFANSKEAGVSEVESVRGKAAAAEISLLEGRWCQVLQTNTRTLEFYSETRSQSFKHVRDEIKKSLGGNHCGSRRTKECTGKFQKRRKDMVRLGHG